MTILLILYFLCAVLLTVYGINCHLMVWLFKRRRRRRIHEDSRILSAFYGGQSPPRDPDRYAHRLPAVTIQLPVFNELNVAERLIEAAAALRYPTGKREIQVLDDSTDETRQIVARKVAQLRRRGIDIRHLTRAEREGFKAGALREGLAAAKGDLLAVFDADFVPPPDFLLQAVPFLVSDDKAGFVQARWGHLNRNQNLVTRLQSIGINGHFMIEQSARNCHDLFMNFNGTAGIFRKQAVLEAGDWQADTLTEDLDLSYRIQLAGWRCRYLADLEVPGEIPGDINALKSQQFRWAKGSMQTARKLLPRVLASDASWWAKLQACLHLTHYLVHPLMLMLAILALPVLLGGIPHLPTIAVTVFTGLLVLSCTGPSRMYVVAENVLHRTRLKTFLLLPALICLGCGLAVNNSKAVLEALLGRKSRFIRTPKAGFAPRKNYAAPRNRLFIFELMIGLWSLVGMALYFAADQYIVGHFLLLYALGFLSVGFLSWNPRNPPR